MSAEPTGNFLNVGIPHDYLYLEKWALYDHTQGHGEFEACSVFGVASLLSRAIGFHVMTERGVQVARVPIHALAWKVDPPPPAMSLPMLELWDCFSYYVSAVAFDFLKGLHCYALLKNGKWYPAHYWFTLDWAAGAYAEGAGEGGHKNAHILKLENGRLAALPNNRIYWREASFITNPLKLTEPPPDYITNSHEWSAEDGAKWSAEDSYRMFYIDEQHDGDAPEPEADGGIPSWTLRAKRRTP